MESGVTAELAGLHWIGLKRAEGSMCRTFRCFLVGILVVLAGLCGCNAAQAAQQGIELVASDSWGVILELCLPAFTLEEIQGLAGPYQQVRLPGWASTTGPGHPALPVATALIQAPRSGLISLDILEEEREVVNRCRIAPVPRLGSMDNPEDNGAPVFEESEAAYGSREFLPEDRVGISERQFVREDCLVRVTVSPFQFNPSTGELLVSKRMRVSVRFESPLAQPWLQTTPPAEPSPAAGRVGDEVFSQMLGRTVLSYAKRENAALPQADESTGGPEAAQTTRIPGRGLSMAASSGKLLRIEIKKVGIYRITYEDLLAEKLDPTTIVPASLRMSNRGREVAIKVESALADRLSPGDAIEFYARGMDDSYTDTNVYWLAWGEEAGKRIESTDGSPSGHAELVNTFTDNVHFGENHVIWSFTPGAPNVNPWFWERLTAPVTKDYSIVVRSVVPDQSEALLKVALQGSTTMAPHPNHHTQILLNGVQIGDATWDGDMKYVHSMSIPKGLLKKGGNAVTVTMPGDTGAEVDSVFLNWIEVEYSRLLEAVNDRLQFHVQGEGRREMVIWKLGRADVRIFDITDPLGPREVTGASVRRVGSFYTATFQDNVDGGKSYLVRTGGGVKRPDLLSAWEPTNLAGSQNGADYILITSRPFLSSVAPLLKWHRSWGMRAKAVAVEDIYNEFNDGIFHPSAIKTFLKAAFANWQRPAPTYVLLVGDATGDYRGYLATGKKNIVPPHLSITQGLGLTPDDGWYACVAGSDPLPDMLIGRLSASTPKAAAQVVAKILAYEKASDYRPDKALFIADDDEIGFETINEELITILPKSISPRRVYLSQAANPAAAHRAIMNGINRGMLITNYVGHGNAFYWSAEKILQDSDVSSLENAGRLTFVTSLDCYNGFFSHPSSYSLGELLVITPKKGAIGSFAPSGTGYPWEHDLLGKALFSAVFEGDSVLGSFTTRAKIDAYARGTSRDLLECYGLIGDPASRLKIVK